MAARALRRAARHAIFTPFLPILPSFCKVKMQFAKLQF
jgi:hypothetical protein